MALTLAQETAIYAALASNQTTAFAASTSGIVEINAGDAVSVQGKADQAGRVFTPIYVTLQASRVR